MKCHYEKLARVPLGYASQFENSVSEAWKTVASTVLEAVGYRWFPGLRLQLGAFCWEVVASFWFIVSWMRPLIYYPYPKQANHSEVVMNHPRNYQLKSMRRDIQWHYKREVSQAQIAEFSKFLWQKQSRDLVPVTGR